MVSIHRAGVRLLYDAPTRRIDMLGVRSYPKDYVDACRRRVEAQVAAYRDIVEATSDDNVVAAFRPAFFNNMTVVLDACFTHRLRTVEGKDGNPLNEVRVVAASVLVDGTLTPDKSIKLRPETSVLGLAAGDEISLDEAGFTALADAYFTEIEKRFVD
jgi:hypothetical protein